MEVIKVLVVLGLVATALASPLKSQAIDSRSESEDYDDDPLEYLAEQASSFFEDLLKEDTLKVKKTKISMRIQMS